MNLANIFGLHIGCNCYAEDNTSGDIGVLTGIRDGAVRIKYTPENKGRWYPIKRATLHLKPLSAITEEHKREFEKEFFTKEWSLKSLILCCDGIEIVANNKDGNKDVYTVHVDEAFFLASRGYDVGAVPAEYKIVETIIKSKGV